MDGDGTGVADSTGSICVTGGCSETNTDVYPYYDPDCLADADCDPGWGCVEERCVALPSLARCAADSLAAEIPWGVTQAPVISLAFVANETPAVLCLGGGSPELLTEGAASQVLAGEVAVIDAVVADLDGDANLEFVATDGAQIFRHGQVAESQPTFLVDASVDRVFVGDATGDTLLDVFGRSTDHLSVVLAPAIGAGDYGMPIDIPLPAAADAVAVGDIDGDGVLELVVAMSMDGTMRIATVDLAAEPAVHLLTGEHEAVSALAVGRLNDDARDDIAVIGPRGASGPTFLTTLLWVSDDVVASNPVSLSGSYATVLIGAFGRGGAESVILGGASELRVVEYDFGEPSCYSVYPSGPGGPATALAAGDRDGDGKPELLRGGGTSVGSFASY